MVPCIIILNLIKTSLMHSSSVLLHLNPLYMFRMQLATVGTRRAGEQITTRALSFTTCMYILMLLRMDARCIRNMQSGLRCNKTLDECIKLVLIKFYILVLNKTVYSRVSKQSTTQLTLLHLAVEVCVSGSSDMSWSVSDIFAQHTVIVSIFLGITYLRYRDNNKSNTPDMIQCTDVSELSYV